MVKIPLTEILWWSANLLTAMLIVRGVRRRLVTKYVLFFSYLCYELAATLVAFYVYSFRPEAYLTFYWHIQFLSVAAGYCVTWEMYRQALKDYPGTARVSQYLVSAFFLLLLGLALVYAFVDEARGLIQNVIQLERNLRVVQTVLLTVLISLVRYYAIPLGRNLWGLIWGYGFFVGVSVIILTLRYYLGSPFYLWWQYSQQVAYLVALAIWVPSFWVYVPNPKADVSIGLEEDYAVLAERAGRRIARARESILRGFLS